MEHEMNCATHELELADIVHALNMWMNYLMGKIFELRTYHNGLKYFFGKPTINAKQVRWLEFLIEYDFDIKHIKGKENEVVSALKKRVHDMHAITIIMYRFYLKYIILEDTNWKKQNLNFDNT
jgi:hypothetical protein